MPRSRACATMCRSCAPGTGAAKAVVDAHRRELAELAVELGEGTDADEVVIAPRRPHRDAGRGECAEIERVDALRR